VTWVDAKRVARRLAFITLAVSRCDGRPDLKAASRQLDLDVAAMQKAVKT
jgi:hypothetical protein